MTNGRLLSPESEARLQDGAGLEQTLATTLDFGVPKEKAPSRASGREGAWGLQRGTRGRRYKALI